MPRSSSFRSAAVLVRLARDPELRRRIRSGIGGRLRDDVLRRDERHRAPSLVHAYDGLTDRSLVLAGVALTGSGRELVLVVDEIRRGAAFAGVRTALAAALGLATRTGRSLRIVMTSATTPGNSAAAAAQLVADHFPETRGADGAPTIEVVPRELIGATVFARDSVWIATYWKTAHALDVAARAGVVDPRCVVYIVQDHEPGFRAWSTDHAVASSTYRAGFTLCVNSTPVAAALERHEDVTADPDLVFAPELDVAGIERARTARQHRARRDPVRVLFYARPGKPRNMFPLGVAALGEAARLLGGRGVAVEFVSAGEPHADLELDGSAVLRSRGTLSWDAYFDLLGDIDVLLSLQQSPHPSHPPLDAASSGARVVTNELGGLRAGLHPSVTAADADPAALGRAVADAVLAHRDHGPLAARSPRASLGAPLEVVLDELARRLTRRGPSERNGASAAVTP